jgi:hypothetical protein
METFLVSQAAMALVPRPANSRRSLVLLTPGDEVPAALEAERNSNPGVRARSVQRALSVAARKWSSVAGFIPSGSGGNSAQVSGAHAAMTSAVTADWGLGANAATPQGTPLAPA